MPASPKYIHQGESMACMLVAGLNAMRYYGFDTPGPGDPEWPGMLWTFGCVHGSCTTGYEEMAWFLCRIRAEQGGVTWPRFVNVDDPEVGEVPGGHAIFEPEQGVVVNYHYITGPVVEHAIVTPRTLGTPDGEPWWSLSRGAD